MPTFRGFSYFVMKVKVPVLILFILLAVPSFVAKDRIDFAYGSSEIYGDGHRIYDPRAKDGYGHCASTGIPDFAAHHHELV